MRVSKGPVSSATYCCSSRCKRGEDGWPRINANPGFSDWDVFEQQCYPKLFFVEERYAKDPTN